MIHNEEWTRSSFCGNGACVEVRWEKSAASLNNGACVEVGTEFAAACSSGSCVEVGHAAGTVLVRDSKDPNGPVLTFTPDEWDAFTAGVRAGQF
jgi:Domain of unknown function (DUF397)